MPLTPASSDMMGAVDEEPGATAILLESTLVGNCTLIRRTSTVSTSGRQVITESAPETFACCLESFPTVRDVTIGGRMITQAVFKLQLPLDSSATADDYVIIDGVTYEVLGTDEGASEAFVLSLRVVRVS